MGLAAASATVFALAVAFSMLGLGGAILYVPLLAGLGYDLKTVAIPTALWLNGVTVLSGALYFTRAGMVDVRGALPMAVAAMAGAPIGAFLTGRVAEPVLLGLFALILVLAAAHMGLGSGRTEPAGTDIRGGRPGLLAVVGLGVGILAGLLGIGGGFLFMLALLATGHEAKQAAGTTAFVSVLPSFAGFAGHAFQGRLDPVLLGGATLAVIAGSQLGPRLMHRRLSPLWVRRAFALVLLAVAVKMALQAWPGLA